MTPARISIPLTALGIVALATCVVPTHARAGDKAQAPTSAGSAQVAPPAAPAPSVPENASELKNPAYAQPVTAAPSAKPNVRITPMMAEIQTMMAEREQAMAAKKQQLAGADAAAVIAIQAEIGLMKRDLEIETLRIQAKWARRENRIADAERLEAVIEEILNPKVRVAPIDRPSPVTDSNR